MASKKLANSTKKGLIKAFSKLYPDPESELNFRNPYELLISVMLSAQCTDKKVNQTTPDLFSKYPDFKSLSKASLTEVENIIRPINYYRTKAKHIIATSKAITEIFEGSVPQTMNELTSLPGVGRKTANVILNELGVEPTIPVDTHVFRVSKRIGLARGKTPEAVEQDLMHELDRKDWRTFHHWLILHGRRVCKAQSPNCLECKINRLCKKIGVPAT